MTQKCNTFLFFVPLWGHALSNIISSGLIAIGVCQLLGDVISYPSMNETGRDAAACALAFLTNLPEACRQILREIQTRPIIAHMIFLYANPSALSQSLK